jgi:6-pyruvoyltetrahydropterin/6-carboxytetrahydropterin synthase
MNAAKIDKSILNTDNGEEVTIYKIIWISSAHKLSLKYESKCNRVHGHNYKIETWVTGKLNEEGMVIDFYHVKNQVMKLDHIYINDVIEPTTAEHVAIYLANKIFDMDPVRLTKVRIRVWETDTAYADYTKN